MAAYRDRLSAPDQAMLEFGGPAAMQPAVVTCSKLAVPVEVVWVAWLELGFNVVRAEGFFQPAHAGLVEPISMLDTARVRSNRGITPVHRATMQRCLRGIAGWGYRDQLAAACNQPRHPTRRRNAGAQRRDRAVVRGRALGRVDVSSDHTPSFRSTRKLPCLLQVEVSTHRLQPDENTFGSSCLRVW